jgi:hypothetical protein
MSDERKPNPTGTRPTAPWTKPAPPAPVSQPISDKSKLPKVEEIGGPQGPEPTRYDDWEVNGRVSDY